MIHKNPQGGYAWLRQGGCAQYKNFRLNPKRRLHANAAGAEQMMLQKICKLKGQKNHEL